CRPLLRPSSSRRCACGISSGACSPKSLRAKAPAMLRLEYAYWLLAAFFALTAWINSRQKRWIATAFWTVLALLFVSGGAILAAVKAGNQQPGQFAGLGVLLLAVLVPRMKREHLTERPEN